MVAVLFNTGLHIPVIPLIDIVGNAVNVAPEQIGVITANVGVILGIIVTLSVCVVAH